MFLSILGIAIVVLLLCNHEPRIQRFSFLFAGLFLALLTCTKDSYPDFVNYEGYYDLVANGQTTISNTFEPVGWWMVCRLLSMFDLTYHGAVVVIILFCCSLMAASIRNVYSGDQGIFWTLYLLLPGFINCAQVKFSLSLTIVFCSVLPYLFGRKHGIIYLILGIALACFIHSSSLVLLILITIPLFERATKKGYTWIIIAVCALISVLATIFAPTFASMVLPYARYKAYFGSESSPSSIIWILRIGLNWCALLLSVYLFYRNKCMGHDNNTSDNALLSSEGSAEPYFEKRALIAIAVLGITLPLLTIDESMHRFIEIGFVIHALLIVAALGNGRKIQLTYIHAGCCICTIVLGFINFTPIRSVVIPLLSFEGFQNLFI